LKKKGPSKAQLEEEAKWRAWSDDKLVKTLTVSIYSTWSEAFQAMDYIKYAQGLNWLTQTSGYFAGGLVMFLVGTRLPKKYGLEGVDIKAVLCAEIDTFIDAGAFS
jgi:microsomal prostaglandin-E synthase 2